VDGGGNTGSTTKAPFISKTAIRFVQALDAAHVQLDSSRLDDLRSHYEQIRASLRRTKDDLPVSEWQHLENTLNTAIKAAQPRNALTV
jgi:hypothetical protein